MVDIKDMKTQYDKFMAQAAEYKFQCPSKCQAHSLLQRLMKKLGEHHILALLVEPRQTSEPNSTLQKIFDQQNNCKFNIPIQSAKRSLAPVNGYNSPNKKIKAIMAPETSAAWINKNGLYNSHRASSISSNNSLHSIKSQNGTSPLSANNNKQTFKHSPFSTPSTSSTPRLIAQGAPDNVPKMQALSLQKTVGTRYYAKNEIMNRQFPSVHPRAKYVHHQTDMGLSKLVFTMDTKISNKLSVNIHRYGPKKFQKFGLAFQSPNSLVWRYTEPNEFPDDRSINVNIPLPPLSSHSTVFTIWFSSNSDPEIMSFPILADLMTLRNGNSYVVTYEPDIVEID